MLRTTMVAGLVGLAAAALTSTASYAATEITFWHAMSAELGTKLESIVDGTSVENARFNADLAVIDRETRREACLNMAAIWW